MGEAYADHWVYSVKVGKPRRSSESVVSYVLSIHEKLEKMVEIVHSNVATAHKTQKSLV